MQSLFEAVCYRQDSKSKCRLVGKPDIQGLFTTTLDGGKYFNCNYMPIINDDQTRKALAFLREGRRLRYIHEPYSFLSFYKVVESQFSSKERVTWIQANLDQLDGDASKRVPNPYAKRIVNFSSHSKHSGDEVGPLKPEEKKVLEQLVKHVIENHLFWQPVAATGDNHGQ